MHPKGYFARVTFALVAIQILYLLGVDALAAAAVLLFLTAVFVFEPNVEGIFQRLFLLCIYTVPFSFIAIDGTPYARNPASVFNLVFLSLILLLSVPALLSRTVASDYLSNRMYVSIGCLFTGIALSYLVSPLTANWLTTAGTMLIYLLFPLLAVAGGRIRHPDRHPQFFLDAFQFMVLSVALVVLLQKGLFQAGYRLGDVEVLFHRTSFVGLLADRSQASVLLAAAAAIFFVRANRQTGEWLTRRLAISCGTACLLASAATSARAGIVAFAVAFVVLIVTRKISLGRAMMLAVIGLPVALLAVGFIFAQRHLVGDVLLNVADRAPLALHWLDIFWDRMPVSLFTGVGLGSDNHEYLGGTFTPHNIVIEALLNGGVWMLAFLLFPLWLLRAHRGNPAYLAGLWTLLLGGLVSPSMMVSRFFPVYLLIGLVLFWKTRALPDPQGAEYRLTPFQNKGIRS